MLGLRRWSALSGHLRDLLREQTDEETADFLMSCLAPAPLSDLVTKNHLETALWAEFSKFALEMAEQ